MDVTYDWPRFWVPQEASYQADGCYLNDPESEYAWAYGTKAKALPSLRHIPALVLLDEAGMGKSRALLQEHEELAASPPADTQLIFRNLNQYGVGEQSRLNAELFGGSEYRNYLDGKALVVSLDSFDECQSSISNLAAK